MRHHRDTMGSLELDRLIRNSMHSDRLINSQCRPMVNQCGQVSRRRQWQLLHQVKVMVILKAIHHKAHSMHHPVVMRIRKDNKHLRQLQCLNQ
ncbi:unnamed protein product [Wuchereria bancrofti]|uniref:Uncharacterized protein n=1 Tax=Wuchereria bancrofti TaxID=6293 RepID=A0A3P7E6F0_WUCBA|nr:unnamed protein product [Wuchereria bancrofti]